MKASELIKSMQESVTQFGDHEVWIETEHDGSRSCQKVDDVLSTSGGGIEDRMVLTSAEATAADPLLALPVCPVGEIKPPQH